MSCPAYNKRAKCRSSLSVLESSSRAWSCRSICSREGSKWLESERNFSIWFFRKENHHRNYNTSKSICHGMPKKLCKKRAVVYWEYAIMYQRENFEKCSLMHFTLWNAKNPASGRRLAAEKICQSLSLLEPAVGFKGRRNFMAMYHFGSNRIRNRTERKYQQLSTWNI